MFDLYKLACQSARHSDADLVGFVCTYALFLKAEALAADAQRPHITNFPL